MINSNGRLPSLTRSGRAKCIEVGIRCRHAVMAARAANHSGEAGIAVVREKIRQMPGIGSSALAAASSPLRSPRSMLLPIEASDAGWLSDIFHGSSKPGHSPKRVTSAGAGQPSRLGEARRLAKAAWREACRNACGKTCGAWDSRPEAFRVEPGRKHMQSREIPNRCGCRAYRQIGRRYQRPQCSRIRLQSASGAADRGEIEGCGLCRNQIACDRRQRQAQPGQACCRRQRSAGGSVPVDPSNANSVLSNKLLENWEVRRQETPLSRRHRFSGYSRLGLPQRTRTSRPVFRSPNWWPRRRTK